MSILYVKVIKYEQKIKTKHFMGLFCKKKPTINVRKDIRDRNTWKDFSILEKIACLNF